MKTLKCITFNVSGHVCAALCFYGDFGRIGTLCACTDCRLCFDILFLSDSLAFTHRSGGEWASGWPEPETCQDLAHSSFFYCLTRKCCASMFCGSARSLFRGNSPSDTIKYVLSYNCFCVINSSFPVSPSERLRISYTVISPHMTLHHMLSLLQMLQCCLGLLCYNSDKPKC